jgi:hypothetical protein
VPQPSINHNYNTFMGGVDLLDSAEKNHAITIRLKKWYWGIYLWFLNMCMVQAWGLYRAQMKRKHQLTQEKEKKEDEEWEKKMQTDIEKKKITKTQVDKLRKERDNISKKKRAEEKISEIPMLEFIRRLVTLTVKKHASPTGTVVSQSEASSRLGSLTATQQTPRGRLTGTTLESVRYDSGDHLPRKSKVKGVCKECKKRSFFRCIRCKVHISPC